MSTSTGSTARARMALQKRFGGTCDDRGCTTSPAENLIPGVSIADCEKDVLRSSAEARARFCAIHSPSALVFNTFAPFRPRPQDLRLLGTAGAHRVEFDSRLPTVPQRRPAQPDLWIERESGIVVVESKLLEYFARRKPTFADGYQQMAPPVAEAAWWSACERFWDGPPGHLDTAQLVKHYFGMSLYRDLNPGCPPMTLLYLFWEPENWTEIEECIEHRRELDEFTSMVEGASIPFVWLTYEDVWREWETDSILVGHTALLRARYGCGI